MMIVSGSSSGASGVGVGVDVDAGVGALCSAGPSPLVFVDVRSRVPSMDCPLIATDAALDSMVGEATSSSCPLDRTRLGDEKSDCDCG
mgnify:CR=1 FL=1